MFSTIVQFLRIHFIPHADNDHRPHALRHGVLFGYGVGLLSLKAFVIAIAIILPSTTVFSSAITASNIIVLANQAREDNNLDALIPNSYLSTAAQNKAEDMLEKNYFAHTSPEGITPWYWIQRAGYSYKVAGENLAVHFSTAESMNESWLASALHRENILNEKFVETGVGISRGTFEGFETIFVVQMFSQPLTPLAKTFDEENFVLDITNTEKVQPEIITAMTTPSVPDTFTPKQATEEDVRIKQTTPSMLQIVPASVSVTPHNYEYHVVAQVPHADSVRAVLGDVSTNFSLASDEDDIWQGTVPFGISQENPAGAHLFLVAKNQNQEIVEEIVIVAPATSPAELFALRERSNYKILGLFSLNFLDDTVSRFYLLVMIMLGGLLIINISVKVHHQKHSTLAHMLVLILLSGVLAIL